MAVTASQVAKLDTIRSTAFGSVTNSYVALGTKFAHPMRIVKFVNTTDADILITFDPSESEDILPAGSFVLYDLDSNKEGANTQFVFAVGSQPYIKYASGAPTLGSVYCVCLYGRGD